MRTDDLLGTEFDWVAVDQTGMIGIFSTAGYGLVPRTALCCADVHGALVDWIGGRAALPAFADLMTFAGNVPVYCFDWVPHSGPYRRVQQPRGLPPIRHDELPEGLREAVVELDLSFGSLEVVAGSEIEIQETGQSGAGQPAPRGESKSKGEEKPQQESEKHSR